MLRAINKSSHKLLEFSRRSLSCIRWVLLLVIGLLGLHLFEAGVTLATVSSSLLIFLLGVTVMLVFSVTQTGMTAVLSGRRTARVSDMIFAMTGPYRWMIQLSIVIIVLITLSALAVNGYLTPSMTAYIPTVLGIFLGAWLFIFWLRYYRLLFYIRSFTKHLNRINPKGLSKREEDWLEDGRSGDLGVILKHRDFFNSLR